MDIKANNWTAEIDYEKNDIVKYEDIGSTTDWNSTNGATAYMLPLMQVAEGNDNLKQDLIVRAFVKKEYESDSLENPSDAFITSEIIPGKGNKINDLTSNAVGIGLSFFDGGSVHYGSLDINNSVTFRSSDDISSNEWFLMEKLVPASCIPTTMGAVAKVKVTLFACGYLQGKFMFKDVSVSNAYPYFYCTKDHLSSSSNSPVTSDTDKWTQDFLWRPSWGGTSSFRGTNYSLKKGEGEGFELSQGINALPQVLDLSFEDRTDKEARAIVHFLQEKYFQYTSIYGLDNMGRRPGTASVSSFKFTLGSVYKERQNFLCKTFNHNLKFRNNNEITASFENIYASELDSVSSFNGPNLRTDLFLYLKIAGGSSPFSVSFVKDTPVIFNIYTSTDANSSIIPAIGTENCQSFSIQFPDEVTEVTPLDLEGAERIVYLNNYRKVRLDSTINSASTTVTLTPFEDFTLSQEKNFFPFLVPCVNGANSIYIKEANDILWYPWLKTRSLPFRASYQQSINQNPRHANSQFTDFYKKLYKVGPNQNLFTLQVVFDYRTEREAKEILLFLEQHLGYRRFQFQLPRPYVKGDLPELTLAEKRISMFFCPEWEHEIVFNDCHRITATFIETPSGGTQEPFGMFSSTALFGCVKSNYFPRLAKYEICPPSAVVQAALGKEFGGRSYFGATTKSTDLILVIDRSGSMSWSSKATVAARVAKQIIGSYRNNPDEAYIYNANVSAIPSEYLPENYGLSETMPNMEDVAANGYNMGNLDKFAIKVDERRVNVAVVYFTTGPSISQSLSPRPRGYNKTQIMSKIAAYAGGGTSFGGAMRTAGGLLHGSERVYNLQNRIIVFISDGIPSDGGTGGSVARTFETGDGSLRLPSAYRDGYVNKVKKLYNSLKASYPTLSETLIDRKIEKAGYDPKSREVIGDWADESLPTLTFTVAVPGADTGRLSSMATQYGPPGSKRGLFFNASSIGQLIKLINIIVHLTEDTGAANYLSFTVTNCGPKPIKITETKVRFLSDPDAPRWTIVKTGGVFNYDDRGIEQSISDTTSLALDPQEDTGGQYINDSANPQWPAEGGSSNWLWKSGTVPDPTDPLKFLQIKRAGVIYDVDNPDGGIPAGPVDPLISSNWNGNAGTDNVGVFCKGKYVRAFSPAEKEVAEDPSLTVSDLNVSNVNAGNPAGDYEHLPWINPGDRIDLFFTIQTNRVFDNLEQIQFVFNTTDGTCNKTSCYANIDINMYTVTNKNQTFGMEAETEPVEDPEA